MLKFWHCPCFFRLLSFSLPPNFFANVDVFWKMWIDVKYFFHDSRTDFFNFCLQSVFQRLTDVFRILLALQVLVLNSFSFYSPFFRRSSGYRRGANYSTFTVTHKPSFAVLQILQSCLARRHFSNCQDHCTALLEMYCDSRISQLRN